jgi:ribokinase
MPGRILGIGHATLDLLGQVPRPPDEDTKIELQAASLQGGGPAATAMVAAAALGARTSFIGKVAGDDLGRMILAGLRGAGVDVERCIVDRTRQMSPFAFIQVLAGKATRTIWYTHGDLDLLKPGDIDATAVDEFQLLLVDGHHPEAQIAAAERARSRGIPVVLDAGSVREGMGELVALADTLIASERFASELAPRGEVEDSVSELQQMGPRTVIVTMGEGGAIGQQGDVRVFEPAYKVDPVVDTTGAGDVYHGAYAWALLEGHPFPKSMKIASIAAGLKCRGLGGRASIPSLADVLQRLE